MPILYGSRPPPDDTIWQRIRDEGFETKIFDRNIRNKEKGVDMEMGLDVAQRLFTESEPGRIVIAAGDADYVPVLDRAKALGWASEVWFWSSATADLRAAAGNDFVRLDDAHAYLEAGGAVPFPPESSR